MRRVSTSNRGLYPVNQTNEIFERTMITKTHSISKTDNDLLSADRSYRKHSRMSHRDSLRPSPRQLASLRHVRTSSNVQNDPNLEAIHRRAYEQHSIETSNVDSGGSVVVTKRIFQLAVGTADDE